MRPPPALAAAALAAALFWAADATLARQTRAFPSLATLPQTPLLAQDVGFASAGARAAGADLAWVQLLRYAAGDLPELADAPGRNYAHVLELCRRVARLDPSFHRAYLFGAGILGWFNGVDRPDDAVALLEEGRRLDPGQKSYELYIAALAYQKKGDVGSEIAALEATFDDAQTSSQMRAILANLHKSRGEYERALEIWASILDHDRDESEHARARLQIPLLRRLIRERRRPQ